MFPPVRFRDCAAADAAAPERSSDMLAPPHAFRQVARLVIELSSQEDNRRRAVKRECP
jgi:hypothetical protein